MSRGHRLNPLKVVWRLIPVGALTVAHSETCGHLQFESLSCLILMLLMMLRPVVCEKLVQLGGPWTSGHSNLGEFWSQQMVRGHWRVFLFEIRWHSGVR